MTDLTQEKGIIVNRESVSHTEFGERSFRSLVFRNLGTETWTSLNSERYGNVKVGYDRLVKYIGQLDTDFPHGVFLVFPTNTPDYKDRNKFSILSVGGNYSDLTATEAVVSSAAFFKEFAERKFLDARDLNFSSEDLASALEQDIKDYGVARRLDNDPSRRTNAGDVSVHAFEGLAFVFMANDRQKQHDASLRLESKFGKSLRR